MASDAAAETLEYTPTWVVAAICTVIVVISLFVERFLHYLGKFLKHKKQKALFEALQKLKEVQAASRNVVPILAAKRRLHWNLELMLLGFISLLLTVSQGVISSICIPASAASYMLPCKRTDSNLKEIIRLNGLPFEPPLNRRRILSGSSASDQCPSPDKVPLLSVEALHQLHIFIFVLAVVHVSFSAITMVLGGAKISQWKHWEDAIHKEISEPTTSSTNEHPIHMYPHYEFVKERALGFGRKTAVGSWLISFFKQFYDSVSRSDYKALRSGFIQRHCRGNETFDFHKYMMRALEDDFKKVVGISWYLWLFVVVFLVLDIHGWHTYFWLSFLPLALLVVVGAKLEHVITRLAQELAADKPGNDEGTPRVKPSDHHFWLHKPGIVLYLIHFILFQNAFEIAFFFWILFTYGFDSCIMESVGYLIPRLVIGVIIQVLCSYSTLPLYAIVTQMGDSYKKAIFDEETQASLQCWAESVRRRTGSGPLSSFMKRIGFKRERSGTSGREFQTQNTASELWECSPEATQPASSDDTITPVEDCLDSLPVE